MQQSCVQSDKLTNYSIATTKTDVSQSLKTVQLLRNSRAKTLGKRTQSCVYIRVLDTIPGAHN